MRDDPLMRKLKSLADGEAQEAPPRVGCAGFVLVPISDPAILQVSVWHDGGPFVRVFVHADDAEEFRKFLELDCRPRLRVLSVTLGKEE